MVKKRFIVIGLIFLLIMFAIAGIVFAIVCRRDTSDTLDGDHCKVNYVVGDIVNYEDFLTKKVSKGHKLEDVSIFPQGVNKFFVGWYYDNEFTKPAEYPIAVKEDLTLHAKYLDGNIPTNNIAYDEAKQEYYVSGKLSDITISTLVIPDMYNDGINGVGKITYIKNVSNTQSLLTDNKTVRELYIGNNIEEVTDYFAYNSASEKVTFGIMLNKIGANAFKGASSLKETTYSEPTGWYMPAKDLVSASMSMVKETDQYAVVFNLTTQFVEPVESLITNAETFGYLRNEDNEMFETKRFEESQTINLTTVLPEKVGYYFEGWYTDSTFSDDSRLGDTITLERGRTVLYAKFLQGNVPSGNLHYNSFSGFYRTSGTISTFADDYNVDGDANTITLVIPDYYDNGSNGVNVVRQVYSSFLKSNTSVQRVCVGNNVVSIGDSAFRDCTNLLSVIISNKVNTLSTHAFRGCTKLESFDMPNNVTNMGNYLFYGCSGLTSVTMSDNLTSIGTHVFYNCIGLTSIIIPNSLTSINAHVFYGCSALTSVTMSDSLTSIGSYAFYGCSALTSVTMSDSLTTIGSSAFYSCTGLSTINLPNTVTSIGSSAFYGCSALTNFIFSESITSIGGSAFRNCVRLTNVKLPDSLITLCSSAFNGCIGFTTMIIPNNVETIEGSVFSGCTSLSKLVISSTKLVSVGSDAFDGCTSLKTMQFNGTIKDWCKIDFYKGTLFTYISNPIQIILKNNLSGMSATINGQSVFGITTISASTIMGATRIGDQAFYGWSSLKSCSVPNTVTSIGGGAFEECKKLESIILPSSVTSIEGEAFYHCSALKKMEYTGTVTEWCKINFGSGFVTVQSNPVELILDNNISGYSATVGGVSITNITAITQQNLAGATKISNTAFCGWSSIKTCDIPDTVTSIGDYAFEKCANLTSITMPGTITNIGEYAFLSCNNLKTLTYSGTINTWCKTRFSITLFGDVSHPIQQIVNNNISGWSVTIDGTNLLQITQVSAEDLEGVTELDRRVFYGWSNLASCDIPDSVKVIDNEAFYKCSKLTSVTIPNTVTELGEGVFRDCTGLKSLTIPSSVKSIDRYAFYGCSGLLTSNGGSGIKIEGSTAWEKASDSWFEDNLSSVTLSDPNKNATWLVNTSEYYNYYWRRVE